VGLTRVRNEELIIRDTIQHLAQFCDGILVYDDCSTDATIDIVRATSSRVWRVIQGDRWSPDRQSEETRHRCMLLDAAHRVGADWVLYLDADERLDRSPRELMHQSADGYRFQLFDAYLTREAHNPYVGGRLCDVDRLYGPERRDILMMWRAGRRFRYLGRDQREPVPALGASVRTAAVHVKHFGKAISVEQWDATCEYYSQHFPEPYRSRWLCRLGKAIHESSDFGSQLLPWDELVPRGDLHRPISRSRPSLKGLLRRFQVSLSTRRPT
jgi:glycosyltransferase involved in cell wall biosynthesis